MDLSTLITPKRKGKERAIEPVGTGHHKPPTGRLTFTSISRDGRQPKERREDLGMNDLDLEELNFQMLDIPAMTTLPWVPASQTDDESESTRIYVPPGVQALIDSKSAVPYMQGILRLAAG